MKKLNLMHIKDDMNMLGRNEMRDIIAGSGSCYQVCTDITAACLNGNPYGSGENGFNSYIDTCRHSTNCCFAQCRGSGSC